jgi:glycosyltransferase involved in cell wall biosynthesis
MTRIRILYCIDSLVRGGTELQLIGLINRLDHTQYKPYLLTIRSTSKVLIPENCVHLDWNIPKLFSMHGFYHILKLVFWLKKERIDIVQTYFQDSTLLVGVAAWLARVDGRIACFRDMAFWNNNRTQKALNKIYPLMTGYISNAEAVSQHFIKKFCLKADKMKVLPNGIDVKKFKFVKHNKGITDICIVGNMTRQVKRTDLFIKATAIVAREHPDIKWHIIGDGHLKGELESLAEDLGVEDSIIFVGRISNVDQYMESMQLGVLCSDSEGLSNAILEYMLKGVVCIATNVGGNPELVDDGITGCLVEANDHNGIAEKILQLINDSSLYRTLALNARQSIEQKYSWGNCIMEHGEFYRKTLENRLCKKGENRE